VHNVSAHDSCDPVCVRGTCEGGECVCERLWTGEDCSMSFNDILGTKHVSSAHSDISDTILETELLPARVVSIVCALLVTAE
jgi:hypothetical protein